MNKPLRIALYAIPLLLFIGLAVLLGSRLGDDPSELPSARIGQPMPDFQLASLTEPARTLTAADLKGQVALLNVWATWCVSCQIEHPVFMQLKAAGIPVYGVNYKDDREAAIQYLAQRGDPFLFSVMDDRGDLGLDLGVYGAPETYLLDKEGNIHYRFVGILDQENWEKELKPRYDALRAEHSLSPEKGSSP